MGTYTTYFGRIRLSESLPTNHQQSLIAMTQGKDTIDGQPFLLQHPEVRNAFLNGGYGIDGFSHMADFRATSEGFALTFCATSKSPGDEYGWLILWLSPWMLHSMEDMVIASVSEDYIVDTERDKVCTEAYCWTQWDWCGAQSRQCDFEKPWSVNPWFRPFLTGVIE